MANKNSNEDKQKQYDESLRYVEQQISNIMNELFEDLSDEEKAQNFEMITTNIFPNPYGGLLIKKWTLSRVLYEYLWAYFYLDTPAGMQILFKKEITVMRGYAWTRFAGWFNEFSDYDEKNEQMTEKEKRMRRLLLYVYPLLQDKFENRIVKTAAVKSIDTGIAKLLLSNYHGYITNREEVKATNTNQSKKSIYEDIDYDKLSIDELNQLETILTKSSSNESTNRTGSK